VIVASSFNEESVRDRAPSVVALMPDLAPANGKLKLVA
jgi:hypothetical protein